MAQPTPTEAQGPTREELQELALRGEALRQQLNAVDAQREYVAEMAAEARRAFSALEHLADAKDGDEVLIPLGAGAFVHGRLATGGSALASLGSGIHAQMPVGDARERMKVRVEQLESAAQTLTRDTTRLADEMTRINAVLETYAG